MFEEKHSLEQHINTLNRNAFDRRAQPNRRYVERNSIEYRLSILHHKLNNRTTQFIRLLAVDRKNRVPVAHESNTRKRERDEKKE